MPRAAKRKPRKNKKKDARSGGFSVPPPLVLILVMAAVLSLFYLWMHGRCEALGLKIQELEGDLTRIEDKVANEESKWANLRSLANVQEALEKHGIEMSWPRESQVIRIRTAKQEEDEDRDQLAGM
ncbi:MAG: hypothetical protein AAF492_05320 [Verrucomicrobiota bacterium]